MYRVRRNNALESADRLLLFGTIHGDVVLLTVGYEMAVDVMRVIDEPVQMILFWRQEGGKALSWFRVVCGRVVEAVITRVDVVFWTHGDGVLCAFGLVWY